MPTKITMELFISNLTNPAFLFFLLGILAVRLKSDLEIPRNSAKFISLYLLFAIGFKGGQELSHHPITTEIVGVLLFGILLSVLIPLYTFYLLRKKLGIFNAAAIGAAYGSVSAVTFVTAISYLEQNHMDFHGHMVAIMALMESPAIIISLILLSAYDKEDNISSTKDILHHSLTNGSVLLIIGSLIIGFLANAEQAEGIKPFTTDLFKGFLAIFLLDMGISCGKKLNSFTQNGWTPVLYSSIAPLVNGSIVAYVSRFFTDEISDRFILAVLAASASYIAVPAAMKLANPKASEGLYLPMALAITFPLNITLGMPLYFYIVN